MLLTKITEPSKQSKISGKVTLQLGHLVKDFLWVSLQDDGSVSVGEFYSDHHHTYHPLGYIHQTRNDGKELTQALNCIDLLMLGQKAPWLRYISNPFVHTPQRNIAKTFEIKFYVPDAHCSTQVNFDFIGERMFDNPANAFKLDKPEMVYTVVPTIVPQSYYILRHHQISLVIYASYLTGQDARSYAQLLG